MIRTLVVFTLICCFAGHLPAQPIQLSGPVEGFIFDVPTGSFRAVLGLPGSAMLGRAIVEGFDYGSVAPYKNYGLGVKDGEYIVVNDLGSANPSLNGLTGLNADSEGVVWSGNGSLAVFFSRSGNWIQTLSGLPGGGTAGTPVDLSLMSGSLSSIAVDASGRQLAIGISGESGGVYLVTDGGAPVPLLACPRPIALTFSEDGLQLYSVDAATLQVTAFQLSNFTSQSFALDGLTDPVAIKLKRDAANRQVLLVAGRSDSLLRIYDTSSNQILADTPLDFAPNALLDFGRNSILLTTRSSNSDPLWLFTTAPRQDVFFVPATSPASGGSE